MTATRLLILFLLFSLAGLTACTGDALTDPTPIPPPPTTSSGGEGGALVATITPGPNNVSTETAAEPTPTLIPTTTPTVTAAATAVTDPPVQVITSQPLPATSRDLLFLADGAFKQWNHTTRQIETVVPGPDPASRVQEGPVLVDQFVGDITGYVMSADGKRAVVARLSNIVTGSEDEFGPVETSHELLFVDMISREIWTLVPQVDNLGDFQLSPDARQLAFTATGLNGIPDAPQGSSDQPLPNHLYLLATGGGNPGGVRQVRTCAIRCFNPAWHVESNLVAFADDSALWLYNIAANEPEMVLENQPFASSMTDVGQVSIYSPIAWAGNGRYLLLWRSRWEGGSRAVLDVPTKTLAPVPDSFVYAEMFPSAVSWMPDDRLLVWRSQTDTGATTPRVELWRFDLSTAALALEESAILSDLPLGVLGGLHLENGRFAFALNLIPSAVNFAAAVQAAGTYRLTSLAETPERVNSLPPAGEPFLESRVFWAKDGSGAIVTQEPVQFQPTVYYAPAEGEFLYDLTAVLGRNPHNFRWQPEIVVP